MKQTLSSLLTFWKLHSTVENIHSHSWEASFRQLGSSFPTGGKLHLYSWLAPSLSSEAPFQLLLLGISLFTAIELPPTAGKFSSHSLEASSPQLGLGKLPFQLEAPFLLVSSLPTGQPPFHSVEGLYQISYILLYRYIELK